MRTLKFLSIGLILLVYVFSFLLSGCTKEAQAQELLKSHELNYGDSTLTVPIAGYSNINIMVCDSSDSKTDTVKAYLEDVFGNKTLAPLKLVDTTVYSLYATRSIGFIKPGDNACINYEVLVPSGYELFLVRTNASGITGRPTWVTVTGLRSSGSEMMEQKNLSYQDTNSLPGGITNPGFY